MAFAIANIQREMFKGGQWCCSVMAPNVLDGERVLAFDLETTGISTSSDRVVQIALVGADPVGTPVHFERIINPRRPIPYGASNVHGIFDEDVRGKGDFSTIADEVADLIEGSVIVGHNVRKFDLEMLESEFLRLGRRMPRPKAVMDTYELVRRLNIPRPHNLGALCSRHGISLENAHTAAADAAASLLLFWRLSVDHAPSFRHSLEELERWVVHGKITSDATDLGRGLGDLELVDQLGKIRKDGDQIILAFGRHKGRDVKEIHFEDPRYIHWLLSAKGVEDESAREIIRSYLGFEESSSDLR